MFCKTKADVPIIAASLYQDSMIRDQGFCVREYIPLKQFDVGINGLPITNEWRVFCYKDQIIIGDYYWLNYPEYKPYNWEQLPTQAFHLLNTVMSIVSQKTNFYVVDIAETNSGEWIVIELNDAQMSGLSMIDPQKFYDRLYDVIE